MTANDRQPGGTHYVAAAQHWDMIIDLGFGSAYFIGCSTKYITRYRKKNGLQDLEKAMHYLDKLIEAVTENRVYLPALRHIQSGRSRGAFKEFIESNSVERSAAQIIDTMVNATELQDLKQAKTGLQNIIENFK